MVLKYISNGVGWNNIWCDRREFCCENFRDFLNSGWSVRNNIWRNKIKNLIFSVCVELLYSLFCSFFFSRKVRQRAVHSCFYTGSVSHSYLSCSAITLYLIRFLRKEMYKVMQYLEGIKYFHLLALCSIACSYERASSRWDDLSFFSFSFFLFTNFITFLMSSFDISAGASGQGVFIIVCRRYYRLQGRGYRRPGAQRSNSREIYSVARKRH